MLFLYLKLHSSLRFIDVKIKSIWDFISATILLSNYIIIYESFDGNLELPLGVILTLTLEKLGLKYDT